MSSSPPRGSRAWREAASRLGTVLAGRYRVDAILAMGGMGAVYRAEHLQLRKAVAIKLLSPAVEGYPILVRRFEREAVAGARLDHPHIAAALDFGSAEDGTQFLVTELVQGETLRDIIKRGPLPPERARSVLRQVAEALATCHGLGILHRDLKPRNILVDEKRADFATLIDFGLARVPDALVRASTPEPADPPADDEAPTLHNLTLKGIVFGTVAYMAPETAFGMEAVDERSDLYALGIVLYEMLAGRHPFDARDPTDLFLQQRVMPPPPLASRAPHPVPPPLEAICMRLLAKRPSDRFQTAVELVSALDAARLDEPRPPMLTPLSTPGPIVLGPGARGYAELFDTRDSAPAPERVSRPPTEPASRWRPGRHRALAVSAAVGLVALGVAALVAAARPVVGPSPAVAPAARGGALVSAAGERAASTARVELEREAARARFHAHADARRWQAAARELRAWILLEPDALVDPSARRAAAAVALRSAFSDLPGTPELFLALAEHAGPGGLDALYEMIESQGGSRGAALAWEAFRRAEIRARAHPALDVALALREAPCNEKAALFPRAAEVGDERALQLLGQLSSLRCREGAGQCCYPRDAGLSSAVRAIEARAAAR